MRLLSALAVLFFHGVPEASTQARPQEKVEAPPVVFSPAELGLQISRITPTFAVYQALQFSPQIQFGQQEVLRRVGGVTITAAPFDTSIIGRGQAGRNQSRTSPTPRGNAPGGAALPSHPFNTYDSLYEWEMGLSKKFRNGITIIPTVNYAYTSLEDVGIANNRSNTGFNFGIVIPLARGLGETVNRAPEIAAQFDWEASLASLRNVTARAVLATVTAYWQCRAAEQRWKLLVENEGFSARFAANAKAMVEAQELASALLAQANADLASTSAQRIQAELDLVRSRQALALAMGTLPEQLTTAPLAADPLPEPLGRVRVPDATELIPAALSLRDDLRAARLIAQSRKSLVTASYLQLRPIIDLRLDAGYTGSEIRSRFSTAERDNAGGSVSLRMEWPVENNRQRGILVQDLAVYGESELRIEDLSRLIASSVITTVNTLRSTSAQMGLLREASREARAALAAQEELFSLGESSLTDVITARQRLIGYELSYVNASERYAISLVQLRYETGTLLPWNEDGNWVSAKLWTSLPFAKP